MRIKNVFWGNVFVKWKCIKQIPGPGILIFFFNFYVFHFPFIQNTKQKSVSFSLLSMVFIFFWSTPCQLPRTDKCIRYMLSMCVYKLYSTFKT